jgi:hypothetical protein
VELPSGVNKSYSPKPSKLLNHTCLHDSKMNYPDLGADDYR